ncbi:MAG: N-6 DNA methylase [Ligilactobacillus saerimneri]|nr:N-6 DNA methylase [Ligilactobacillus saerimneri]
MNERLIKSTDRVKDHGEVFTPKNIVNLMLDQPEIQAKIQDLTATFLEPAAGEGAFLVELLHRKMQVALKQSHSAKEFDEHALMALASLYGIEYLEDNMEMLVMNMLVAFRDDYRDSIRQHFASEPNSKVEKSAQVIIQANMVHGDTLKKVDVQGNPLIFSEWTNIPGRVNKVQRTEYTFEAILAGAGPNDVVTGARQGEVEQLDLFSALAPEPSVDEQTLTTYAPVKWQDIYLRKVLPKE